MRSSLAVLRAVRTSEADEREGGTDIMIFTCTVCGSFEWMAVAPGTAPDASRFLQFNPFELRPAEPVPAVAFCLAHWSERFAVDAVGVPA